MRKRVALTVLAIALVGVAARQVLREREPVYQGKRLSVWLQRYIRGGSIIDVLPEPEADEGGCPSNRYQCHPDPIAVVKGA